MPDIATIINHSREAVERYLHDFESIKLLAMKFDDVVLISRLVGLTPKVVKQYLDLIPLDS